MAAFWSNKEQTFKPGKSNYVLDILDSDTELGIYLLTGLMMDHHSQNLFHKLKFVCDVISQGFNSKRLEMYLEHKQPLFKELLTCSFRQTFPLSNSYAEHSLLDLQTLVKFISFTGALYM